MSTIIYIILISIFIELITLFGRLILHRRGARIQEELHWPRIHHFYIGMVFIFIYFLLPENLLITKLAVIIGLSLMISDFFHHLVFIPLVEKYKLDVGMIHHRIVHNYLQGVVAILLILIGLFSLLTPFTPGLWLIPIGLIALLGHEKAKNFLRILTGDKLYEKLKLDFFLKDRGRGKWRDV